MAAAIGNGAQPSFLMLRSTPMACLEARRTVGPSFEAARTSSEPHLRMRVVDSEGDG